MRRILPLALLVVVLAGCAPAPTVPTAAPTVPVAETSTPTPTPVPTQKPETGLVQPAQVFDGDCDALYSPEDARSILSKNLERKVVKDFSGDAYDFLDDQVGGMTCSWATPDWGTGVMVSVVPVALLPFTTAKACAKSVDGSDGYECEIEAEANEMRLSGKAWFAKDGLSNATKTAQLVSLFEDRAAAAERVPLPIPHADSWSNPVGCSILEPLLDDPKMLGGTGDLTIYQGNGTDAYFTPAQHVLYGFADRAASVACTITTADPNRELTKAELKAGKIRDISFSLAGGAAWVRNELADWDGTKKLSIDGVDSAYLVVGDDGDGWHEIVVFDGPNMLSVSTTLDDMERKYATISLVVEALNAR